MPPVLYQALCRSRRSDRRERSQRSETMDVTFCVLFSDMARSRFKEWVFAAGWGRRSSRSMCRGEPRVRPLARTVRCEHEVQGAHEVRPYEWHPTDVERIAAAQTGEDAAT